MFVWAEIPEEHREAGSLEFAKFLLQEGKVAVSPGVGFGARAIASCVSLSSRRAPHQAGDARDPQGARRMNPEVKAGARW